MKEKYYVVAKTISRWKLDNRFENWLGYKADKNDCWKRLYLLYYKIFDYKYYKGGLVLAQKNIKEQLPHITKQSPGCTQITENWLLRDMIYSLHRFGTSFQDYFIFKFYEKNTIGREQFVNLKIQYGYCELVNSPTIRDIFDDKGVCYQYFKEFYKRDVVSVYNDSHIGELDAFLDTHKSFIYKPYRCHSGHGIKIYKDFNGDARSFYEEHYRYGAFVLEELIIQGEELAAIHKESINTLRLLTFVVKDEVEIYGACLRMGVGNAVVDNAGSGGIYAIVDICNGIVTSTGRNYRNEYYTLHPDSNVVIPGYRLPYWNEAIDLVKKAALTVKGATVISWDLAYSIKGWVIVEGNDVGEPRLIQSPYQIGFKNVLIDLIDRFRAEQP